MYLTEQALPKTILSLERFHVKEHSTEDQGIVDVRTITITRHTFVLFLALSTSAGDPFSE